MEKERLRTLFQLAIAVGRRKGLLANEPPSEGDCVQYPVNGCVAALENTEAQESSREVFISRSTTP